MKGIIGSYSASAIALTTSITLPPPDATMVKTWHSIVKYGMHDEPVKRLVANAQTAIDIYDEYGYSCKLGHARIEDDLEDYDLANTLMCNANIKRNVLAPMKLWLMLSLITGVNDELEHLRSDKNTFLLPKGQLRVEIFDIERLSPSTNGKLWTCSFRGETHGWYGRVSAKGLLQSGERIFFPYTKGPAH